MTRRELLDPFGSDEDEEENKNSSNERDKTSKSQINADAANVGK